MPELGRAIAAHVARKNDTHYICVGTCLREAQTENASIDFWGGKPCQRVLPESCSNTLFSHLGNYVEPLH